MKCYKNYIPKAIEFAYFFKEGSPVNSIALGITYDEVLLMRFHILTLFPQFIAQGMSYGVVGRAVSKGLVELDLVNPRQFTSDVHQSVDDRPFGGGDGMLMLAEPLKQSIESLGAYKGHVVFLSPQGNKWCDQRAWDWSRNYKDITLICGRYGGIDQRFIEKYAHEEISLGDFILSGGEIAALGIMDSIIRRLPGVLGNEVSHQVESFQDSLLEPPQFTRPREWEGERVPEILFSGNHKNIQIWKENLALVKTAQRRPDLLNSQQRSRLVKARDEILKMDDDELFSCGLERSELKKIL